MQNGTAFILFLRKEISGKGASEKQFESGEKRKKKEARLELNKNSSFSFDAFIVYIYFSEVSKLKILSNKITNIAY